MNLNLLIDSTVDSATEFDYYFFDDKTIVICFWILTDDWIAEISCENWFLLRRESKRLCFPSPCLGLHSHVLLFRFPPCIFRMAFHHIRCSIPIQFANYYSIFREGQQTVWRSMVDHFQQKKTFMTLCAALHSYRLAIFVCFISSQMSLFYDLIVRPDTLLHPFQHYIWTWTFYNVDPDCWHFSGGCYLNSLIKSINL